LDITGCNIRPRPGRPDEMSPSVGQDGLDFVVDVPQMVVVVEVEVVDDEHDMRESDDIVEAVDAVGVS